MTMMFLFSIHNRLNWGRFYAPLGIEVNANVIWGWATTSRVKRQLHSYTMKRTTNYNTIKLINSLSILTILHVSFCLMKLAPSSKLNRTPPGQQVENSSLLEQSYSLMLHI